MNRRFAALALTLTIAACDEPATPPSTSTSTGPTVQEPPLPADWPKLGKTEPSPDWLRHKWAGFAPGSYAIVRELRELGDRSETLITRTTVKEADAEKATLVHERQGGKREEATAELRPRVAVSGTGTVDADGKAFECTILETEDREGSARVWVKIWACASAPGRIVKREQRVWSPRAGEMAGTGQITRLGQQRDVGGRTLTYAVFEFEAKGASGATATIVQWVSEEVPGFLVREEKTESIGGKSLRTVKELVEFEAKRP